MNAFGFGTGRAMLVVAGLAASLATSNAFAGNVYYPTTAATPYYYTTPSYGGAGPMISGYRPAATYSSSCPGGVCPTQPTYTTRTPITGVAGAGVPGNCPGGVCYPAAMTKNCPNGQCPPSLGMKNCPNGQCPPSLGTKAVYPANYNVAPKYVAPKAVMPTAPVYYGTSKSAPTAVDTPIFYELGTPAAPRGPVTPVGAIDSANDSPFYP